MVNWLKKCVHVVPAFCFLQAMGGPPIDTMRLQEVCITGYNLTQFSTGNKIEAIRKNLLESYHHSNVGELLQQTSQLNVSNYGSLSNVSIRGTGTSHTAILWNGFNIQNTLNGGVNMTLLPVSFMDDIQVQYGGGSALFGSGAMGGIIHLNNRLEYSKGLSIRVDGGIGSFGMQQASASIKFSNAFYSGSLRFNEQSAKNNFTFRNTAEYKTPLDTQKNAAMRGKGILLDNQFRINPNNQMISHLWIQQYDQGIPSPVIQSEANGKQVTSDLRGTLEYQHTSDMHDVYVRTAYFNEHMIYTSNMEYGNHRAVTFIGEAEGRFKPGANHTIRYGSNYIREAGGSNNFGELHIRNRNALFGSYKVTNSSRSVVAMFNLREEFLNGQSTPLTFSMGANYYITSSFQLKGNVSKNYRLPDFNALYWDLWGNPELKPESGYSGDIGYNYKRKIGDLNISFGNSVFAGFTRNLIIWMPAASGIIWHPYNLNQVFARGLETEGKASYSINDFKLGGGVSYSLIYSTNMKGDVSAKDLIVNLTKGQQVLYAPRNKAAANVECTYKSYGLTYIQNFCGMRYYDVVNKFYVNRYSLGNVALSKRFSVMKTNIRLSFHINNIWNSTYQVMAWYPMPGRNYMMNLSFAFN